MIKRRMLAAAHALWVLVLATAMAGAAAAQGVTTSAITGRVTNAQGEPVDGAQVVATNTATGREYRVVTRDGGRYQLQGLQPGGPYTVRVAGMGFEGQARTGVNLALSQTARFDFSLAPEALAIEGLSVVVERGNVISRGRTGTATVVSDSAIARLPTITRDFTDFTRLTPQISTSGDASNAGGRNSRFNTIQIDGAVNNDLFGLNSGGTPGSGSDAKPITLEAIQEFQVAIAPFDVRQGGFTGAAINAVTKPGTNDFRGSLTLFNRNESLVGNYRFPDTGEKGPAFADFTHTEAGFSLGGPIIRDKLHFFTAGEITRRSAPINNVAGTSTSEISIQEAQAVADILRNQYGYEPGEVGAMNLGTEGHNLFGRVDWSINSNHRLTLRHNYVDGVRDDLSRSNSLYFLGGSLFERDNVNTSTVAQLNSIFRSQFFNELRIGFSTIRDKRIPQDNTPSVRVALPVGPGGSRALFAGSEQFSGQNELDQDVVEVTNDLTFTRGMHNITLGTHNEFFGFSNLFVRNAFGYYEFNSPADLQAARASRYEYSYLLPGGSERAEFDVRQLSFYVQDQMDLTENFSLTAGVRYDVTHFPDNPGRNTAFEQAFSTLGRRTDAVPSGKGQFSPRVGFNWDVLGDRSTQVRGGVGLFSGRTPYVWISNVYGNTGLDYVRFTCTGNATPRFVSDPANQPRNCVGNTSLAANEINLADPDFELPQVFRTSFAVDRRLPLGFTGTLEGLYSQSVNDVLYRELNLRPASGTVEGGRPRYAGRLSNAFANVTDITNTDEGYNYSVTGQLQRPFRENFDFSLAYTFTRARDVNSVTSSQAFSNWRFNPIDADPNDPDLRPSNFEVPHRVLASGSYQFGFLRRGPTDVSFIYVGESGRPYSYSYNGDVNNDGSNGNDLFYVPANASEIRFQGTQAQQAESWQNLNAFIESVDCLRGARGTIVKRNACRQPWSNRIDLRIAQTVPTLRGQGVQVTANIINFGNLLNEEWGLSQFVSNQNDALLSTASTTPDANGRVQFRPFGAGKRQFNTSNLSSRYQIQLGVRYSF